MKKTLMKLLPSVLSILLIATAAYAGSIHVWASGDVLTAADINANFTHIHSTMVGAHGARLVDGDISSSAFISHTKMATPALLPKAWAYVPDNCSASPCTISASAGPISGTGITRIGTGNYAVNIFPNRPNNAYLIQVTANNNGRTYCTTMGPQTNSGTTFACYKDDGTATDTGFGIVVWDNDN